MPLSAEECQECTEQQTLFRPSHTVRSAVVSFQVKKTLKPLRSLQHHLPRRQQSPSLPQPLNPPQPSPPPRWLPPPPLPPLPPPPPPPLPHLHHRPRLPRLDLQSIKSGMQVTGCRSTNLFFCWKQWIFVLSLKDCVCQTNPLKRSTAARVLPFAGIRLTTLAACKPRRCLPVEALIPRRRRTLVITSRACNYDKLQPACDEDQASPPDPTVHLIAGPLAGLNKRNHFWPTVKVSHLPCLGLKTQPVDNAAVS